MAEKHSAPLGVSAEDVGEEISLDNIDKILEESDPSFAQELESISSDEELKSAEIELFHVDDSALLTDDELEKRSLEFSQQHPRLHKLLTPLRGLKSFIFLRFYRWRNLLQLAWEGLLSFFRVGLPERLKYLASQIQAFNLRLKAHLAAWRALPLKTKLALTACALLGIAALALIYVNLEGRWVPSLVHRPETDFSQHATAVKSFNSNEDLVPFYRYFPQPQHTVLLGKFVVNLRRVKPGENPMGAFELYVNGDSQATAIEVKDREKELLDRVARAVESLSFLEVSGSLGKARLKALVRQEINEALNQGRVEQIFFKTIIIKP